MNNQLRLDVLYKIDSISEAYCKPCGDKGNISTVCVKCPHGIRLKELGDQLNQMKRERIRVSKLKANKEVLSKNTYVNMRSRGMNKAAIASHFGIKPATLSYHIKKWEEEGMKEEAVKPVASKPKAAKEPLAQESKQEEYKNLMNELSGKLKMSEATTRELEEKLQHYQSIADFSHQEKEKAQHEALTTKSDYEALNDSYKKLQAEINELQKKNKELANQYDEYTTGLETQHVNLELENEQLLVQLEELRAENARFKLNNAFEPAAVEINPSSLSQEVEKLTEEVARLTYENSLYKQTLKIAL